jgi:hypothetical protein
MAIWKETDLITDLNNKFEKVGTPVIVESQDSKGVTWLQVNVLESGLSDGLQVPTAQRKNIDYYVLNRGNSSTEKAWYRDEPVNSSSKEPIAGGLTGNKLTSSLYKSVEIRDKVLGQIGSTALAVYAETTATTNHVARLKLATDSLFNPEKNVNIFMMLCALDSTIRTVGSLATDTDIANVVNGKWTAVSINMV